MPGFEWIDKKELNVVKKIFYEGGTLIAHGFDKIRKNYYVRDFEKCLPGSRLLIKSSLNS